MCFPSLLLVPFMKQKLITLRIIELLTVYNIFTKIKYFSCRSYVCAIDFKVINSLSFIKFVYHDSRFLSCRLPNFSQLQILYNYKQNQKLNNKEIYDK